MRTGEGQPRPEDPSTRVDAFSRAILSEKDPVVRGYMENLRSQIAAIAARHGANARDVWNAEVQALMSVDEMERVNELFGMIKGVSEKKLSRMQEREMLDGLVPREKEALLMMARANRLNRMSGGVNAAFVSWFLLSGLFDTAENFAKTHGGHELLALVSLARVADLGDDVPEDVRVGMLWSAADEARRQSEATVHALRTFLSAYGAMLPFLSDEEVKDQLSYQMRFADGYAPLAFARLKMEIALRELSLDVRQQDIFDVLERAAKDAFRRGGSEKARIEMLLVSAEAIHSLGGDARAWIDVAIADAKTAHEANERFDAAEAVACIADSAARIGAWDLIDSLQEEGWWWDPALFGPKPNVRARTANGCVASGNFNKAIEFATAPGFLDSFGGDVFCLTLVGALYDANQIERAELLCKRLEADTNGSLYENTTPSRLVARARRGDEVLTFADVKATNRLASGLWPTTDEQSMILGAAAIGTIGYTAAMRKRIEEYASNR